MNSFTLEILEGGEWVRPIAVFPFTVGELLDERLDEGNVVFYSRTREYKPLTEVRISYYKDGEPDYDADGSYIDYFITANDNAAEYPAGSGRYKHEIYLIERMKLTEGILCPSLTFTNSLPTLTRPIGSRVTPEVVEANDAANLSGNFPGAGNFYTNIPSNIPFVAPSIKTQAEGLKIANASNPNLGTNRAGISSAGVYQWVYAAINGVEKVRLIAPEGYDSELLIPADMLSEGDTVLVRYFLMYEDIVGTSVSAINSYYVSYTMTVNNVADLKPYYITDCVCRVLEEAEPLDFREVPRFDFDGVIRDNRSGDITGYAAGSEAEKYDKIRAPEFTLTQSTLREQLRTIGGFIHAEPYIDENNKVHFLEYGQTAVSDVGGKPYISNTVKWDINQYCTEIRSNAQNLTSSLGFAKGAKIEPLPNAYRALRTETGYQRVNEANGIYDTDESIYEISSVKVGLLVGKAAAQSWATVDNVMLVDIDITKFIVEQTVYNANLYPTGSYPFSRSYALCYTIGERGIKGLFYQPEAAYNQGAMPFAIANIMALATGVSAQSVHDLLTAPLSNGNTPPCNLVFRITYKPISSALVSHGKQSYVAGETPYTLVYNQSDNLVETEYYGEHLKGVAARMGNVEAERTFILSSRASIPRVGYMLDGYAISAVSCEYMPQYIKCTVGLTKDFNRISEYVGINSVKRMYEISERQSQERNILINRTCLITEYDTTPNTSNPIFEPSGFINAINPVPYTPQNYDSEIVTSALVTTKKKGTQADIATVLLPVTARSFGNSVHFSFGMKDNFSAGSQTEWITASDVSGRWQKDVPYSDYYGRTWWLSFGLVTRSSADINTAFTLPSADDISVSETTLDNRGEFVTTVAYTHRLRKDSRECIRYNVEVGYKTDVPDLIIGSELAARCRYLNNYDTARPYLYITETDISKLQRTFLPSINDFRGDTGGYMTMNVTDNALTLTFARSITMEGASTLARLKYWVICSPVTTSEERYIDESGNEVVQTVTKGGEIILAGKIPKTGNGATQTLYFVIK